MSLPHVSSIVFHLCYMTEMKVKERGTTVLAAAAATLVSAGPVKAKL